MVQDTGIGVAPQVQERLFAPFAQADASITRRFGGTGLGLSIVKRLANLMGGEVSLVSTPGAGSEFRVVLDFALASAEALARLEAAPAAPGDQPLMGVRVLVVDDSDDNLDVTKRILELEGAQVWLASNGLEAFNLLQAEPDAVDVVLMDVQMPVLDGHDATRRIRLELKLTDLPIIALTAGALSSERQRATAAGMDDYIVKPLDANALLASILRRVEPGRRRSPWRGDDSGLAHARGAGSAAAWPEIEGIDSRDARERLGNDFGLFRSMLERLLGEFSDAAIPAPSEEPLALALHAGRMHKLRGSAGMLGATAIQKLAGEAEAACRAGQAERAAALAVKLVAGLRRLRHACAPAFAANPPRIEQALLHEDAGFDSQTVADFVDLLRQQSLSAVERFGVLSPQLHRLLSKGSYEMLRGHIDNLRFDEAARELETNLAA